MDEESVFPIFVIGCFLAFFMLLLLGAYGIRTSQYIHLKKIEKWDGHVPLEGLVMTKGK